MQEVEGFLNGTLNYTLLEGSTGPLVWVFIVRVIVMSFAIK